MQTRANAISKKNRATRCRSPRLTSPKRSCTPRRTGSSVLPTPASSGQVCLRHPRGTAYGCFLPDLTRFTGSRRAGPNLPHRTMPAVTEALSPQGGIRSRYGGLRVQGTASSPSSTTRRRGRDLNPRGCYTYTISNRAHSTGLCDLSTGYPPWHGTTSPQGDPFTGNGPRSGDDSFRVVRKQLFSFVRK